MEYLIEAMEKKNSNRRFADYFEEKVIATDALIILGEKKKKNNRRFAANFGRKSNSH